MVEAKAVRVDDQQVDLGTAWQQIVEDLQPNQRAWLRPSVPVTLHENTAIIAVPNDFTRNQLEGRLRNHIEDALTEAFGREIRQQCFQHYEFVHAAGATGHGQVHVRHAAATELG